MRIDHRLTLPTANLLTALGLLLFAASARAGGLLDLDPQGPIAGSERELLLIALGLMLVVLIPVFVMPIWFAWWYRASNTQATYMPEWTSVRLDRVVWILPALIVAALATLAWTYTHRLDPYKPIDSNVAPLKVQVVALNWKWLFIYPKQGIATVNKLVIPVHRPVSFDITSDTVMNAFFIPQLGGQIFAMAGMRTKLHLLAERTGTFFGENTQYSGRGFPYQHFEVLAEPQARFDAWIKAVKQQGESLSWANYQALQQPGIKVPVRNYAAVDEGLFDRIIGKYSATQPGP
jgi:cytochrome o ubiquinol oxidase subunit 2